MTLTAEQSSNKAKYEAAPTSEIIDIIRTAMGQGCIRPCHVYDAVDELICRIQALENRPKRNCDVGTADEQAQRFYDFCTEHSSAIQGMCDYKCPCIDSGDKCHCLFKWSHMLYDERGDK